MWNERNTVLNDYIHPLQLQTFETVNTNDLRVEAFGSNLALPSFLWFTGNEEIVATVAIHRGPVDYTYKPIVLALKAQCEADMDTSSFDMILTNAVDDDNNGILEFLRPCPKVRWAGDILIDQTFSINKDSNNVMKVSIFNLNINRLHDETIDGNILEYAVLQYRKKGSPLWMEAKTKNNEALYFAKEGLEDDYGYIAVDWHAQNIKADGQYEMRVLCKCLGDSSVPANFKEFSTDIISGYIDKRPPSIYGKPSVLMNKYNHPDQEVLFTFTEDIYCGKPFTFEIELDAVNDDNLPALSNDDLQILCEKNILRFHFNPIIRGKLSGKKMKINLSDVIDLAGNAMTYETVFDFADGKQRRKLEVDDASFTVTNQEELQREVKEMKDLMMKVLQKME